MNVLVTGGAGFIGSHLVERLSLDGFNVTVIDNLSTGKESNISSCKNVNFINFDISNSLESLNLPRFDYIFHLAALADIVPSITNPSYYFSANVVGTLNVLEFARDKTPKKFFYSASSSCYGIPISYPTPETSTNNPLYPYALTKKMGEDLLQHWGKLYSIPYISFRLFNVYGRRARTSGSYGAVLGVFLAQKINDLPLTVVGDGNQKRDFTHVLDVVDAFMLGMTSQIENEIFNIGSGSPHSINEIVKIMDHDVQYIPKRPGEPDLTWADISKVRSRLNWEAKISFENGINEILKEINLWKDAPVWTVESISLATRDWFKHLN